MAVLMSAGTGFPRGFYGRFARWMAALSQGRLIGPARVRGMWTAEKLNSGADGAWAAGWPVLGSPGDRQVAGIGGARAAVVVTGGTVPGERAGEGQGIGRLAAALSRHGDGRGMNALIFAITKAHRETDTRGFVAGAVTSFIATVSAFVTLGILLIAVTVLPTLALIWPFAESRESAILWLRWPVVAVVLWVAVLLLFRNAPHRRSPETRWVVPGAILATALWLLGSAALSFFIENFGRYDATFGSIAAAAVFMLWLYVSAIVLVSGAALNAELEWRTRKDTTVGPDRPMGQRNAYVADTLAADTADPMCERTHPTNNRHEETGDGQTR